VGVNRALRPISTWCGGGTESRHHYTYTSEKMLLEVELASAWSALLDDLQDLLQWVNIQSVMDADLLLFVP
jgi:hypothetical protein